MYKHILTCILSILTFVNFATAQVYISPNDTIALSLSTELMVSGDLFNNGFVWNGGAVTVNGSYHNQNGSTSCGLGDYTIAGNFLNLGSIKCSSNKVVIDGSGVSIINFGADTIGELILEKSGISTVKLIGNLKIASSLQFKSDVVLETNSDTVFLMNDASAALSSNAPFSNSRYIKGNFSRKVTNGVSYVFPVGNYNLKRADITKIKNLSGPEMVTVAFRSAVQGIKPLQVANEGPYDSICSPGTWVISAGKNNTAAKMDLRLYTDNMYMPGTMKCAVLKRPIGSTSASDWSAGSGWLRTIISNLSLPIASANYTERYEVQGLDGEYGLGNEAEFLQVKVKALLSGPWPVNGTAMNTSLNTPSANFPNGVLAAAALKNPYSSAPWNYAGTEEVTAAFFAANRDIVDWILVELRSTATTAAVARKAGFIKKDGAIVDINGIDPIRFEKAAAGDYYIVVKHRNHLPVMSAQPVTLPNANAYDFSTGMDKAYGFAAASKPMQTISGGQFGMWAGDANSDYNVRYIGTPNDVTPIQIVVGGVSSVPKIGYFKEDLNMNGNVRYIGTDNDITTIQLTVGGVSSVPKFSAVPSPNL